MNFEKQEKAFKSVVEYFHDLTKMTHTKSVCNQYESLNISANMDVEQVTKSLNHLLLYKKELSQEILKNKNEDSNKVLLESMKYVDSLIMKVLGIENNF